MNSIAKIALITTFLISSVIANAAFISTSSGAFSGNGEYNEATGTGVVRVFNVSKGNGFTYAQIEDTFTTAGVFSFDWRLSRMSHDSPLAGGYLLNGTKFQLGFSDDFYIIPSGSTSVTIAAGDTFGWYVESTISSESESRFTLSNASFTPSPSAVPVPAAAWLFGSALLGVAGLRRKQQA